MPKGAPDPNEGTTDTRSAEIEKAVQESRHPAAKPVDPPYKSGDLLFFHSETNKDKITHVGKASAFNYPQTQVYYPPGGEALGVRLAKQLDVPAQPLPGGSDPRRLVVIVGPKRLASN